MAKKKKNSVYERIQEVGKRRGIVYPSFEIYGGVSGFYDYGPMGSRIKKNMEDLIREFYLIEENCFEVECPILSPEDVWIASGHVENFTDTLTECVKCGEPYRADHLVEDHLEKPCDHLGVSELNEKIKELEISCPKCGGFLDRVYDYNLMFHTYVGPGKYKTSAYLRPETAQSTYLSFKRLWEVGRKKLPIGALQIGRSFRNEISPRQGMIRLREFNQAEAQFFVHPDKKETEKFEEVSDMKVNLLDKDEQTRELTLKEALDQKLIANQLIAYYLGRSIQLFEQMGISRKRLKLRQHKDEERAFYAKDTWDVEYISPELGRVELVGVSDRTDYDLTQHMNLSNEKLKVTVDGDRFVPHVIEVAYGIDRPFYCLLESSFNDDENRTYLSLPPKIAPYAAAVFPLTRKDDLPERAQELYDKLKDANILAKYDESGSIGKRYARADEIGVPYCFTVDYDTLEDDTVTIRYRDSMEQERVSIDQAPEYVIQGV